MLCEAYRATRNPSIILIVPTGSLDGVPISVLERLGDLQFAGYITIDSGLPISGIPVDKVVKGVSATGYYIHNPKSSSSESSAAAVIGGALIGAGFGGGTGAIIGGLIGAILAHISSKHGQA
jgi:uncharacterized protein YcgL (UPF0745 family)